MEELKRIIDDSEITKEDDALWPPPDRVGRQVCGKESCCLLKKVVYLLMQCLSILRRTSLMLFSVLYKELEIVIGDEHISFTTSKIGSLIDVNQSK